ncbi:hypothetical protein ACHAWU_006398 [Discostella pseudostelligera]|uniref:Uncharacterized protein n=1 Tax=Discostella pseudostelligera TaxID=259834 RepID=A0ABD3N3Y4_9STRA
MLLHHANGQYERMISGKGSNRGHVHVTELIMVAVAARVAMHATLPCLGIKSTFAPAIAASGVSRIDRSGISNNFSPASSDTAASIAAYLI